MTSPSPSVTSTALNATPFWPSVPELNVRVTVSFRPSWVLMSPRSVPSAIVTDFMRHEPSVPTAYIV